MGIETALLAAAVIGAGTAVHSTQEQKKERKKQKKKAEVLGKKQIKIAAVQRERDKSMQAQTTKQGAYLGGSSLLG